MEKWSCEVCVDKWSVSSVSRCVYFLQEREDNTKTNLTKGREEETILVKLALGPRDDSYQFVSHRWQGEMRRTKGNPISDNINNTVPAASRPTADISGSRPLSVLRSGMRRPRRRHRCVAEYEPILPPPHVGYFKPTLLTLQCAQRSQLQQLLQFRCKTATRRLIHLLSSR